MNQNLAASDWATARGEKWCAQLSPMEAMLSTVDDPLIRALHLEAPSRIADVGCGGGGTTLEVLRQAPAGSIVHGFDISPALIEAAQARRKPDDAAVFELADVATAAPDEPYDRLLSRFGIMFYDDPPTAFANLARWLTPDGRFAFATWGPPAENLWVTVVRGVVAEVVDIPAADPEGPGPFRYAEGDRLLDLLDQAGFRDLEVHDWRGALPVGGGLPAAEAAQFALSSYSFASGLAETAEETAEGVRESLTECFSRHQEDGIVRMEACVHLFTGGR